MMDATPQEPRNTDASPRRPGWRRWMIFVAIAGVFLPLAAVIGEMVFRFCSSFFLDPMPTVWHPVLLLLVPAANLVAILAYIRGAEQKPGAATLLVGVSIGIALVYSVQFIVIVPFCFPGLLFLGLGALGFAPYLGLASSLLCNARLKDLHREHGTRHAWLMWSGMLASILVLLAFIGTMFATSQGMKMAASGDEAVSRRGIRLIRAVGSESVLLRACYGLPSGMWPDPSAVTWNWNPEARAEARATYYRVTGRSFNSVTPPKLVGFRSEMTRDFESDSDVGGTAVNSRVTDLNMSSSRLDAVVAPDSLTAYTEWTLVFANRSATDREARAEIALPPGGVVSRLTLWIEGEEREAAFGPRGQVRQAYREVAVVQRRDPVLVTSTGPDRVLVQCFPVTPDGTMKVRLGITSPLWASAARPDRAIFILPYFMERNFGIPTAVKHALFVESPKALSFRDAAESVPSSVLRSGISDTELSSDKRAIVCERADARRVWAPDTVEPGKYAVVQTVSSSAPPPPKSVVVVIDGSGSLAKTWNEGLAHSIASMPGSLALGTRFGVILASDEVIELVPFGPVTSRDANRPIRLVGRAQFVGGIDNRPALLKACDIALSNPNTAILWIHGPQPLVSDTYAEQLLQCWERRPGFATVYSVSAADGRNTILSDLERVGAVEAVPHLGTLEEDIARLVEQWRGEPTGLFAVRERLPVSKVGNAVRGSSHICRLWARDEVIRTSRRADSRLVRQAAELAAQHQIVTGVSGAVVLETKEQYERHDLKPVDPATVPTVVPEPSSWIVLGIGLALVVLASRRRLIRRPAVIPRR